MKARWAVDSAGVAVHPPLLADSRRWRDFGACAHMDPDRFFPPEGVNGITVQPIKEICRGCPVRGECLIYALDHPDTSRDGVWAGFTRAEIRKISRQRAQAAPKKVA